MKPKKINLSKSNSLVQPMKAGYRLNLPPQLVGKFHEFLQRNTHNHKLSYINQLILQNLYGKILMKLMLVPQEGIKIKITSPELIALAEIPYTFDYGFNAQIQEHKDNLIHQLAFNNVI